ncbi:hypothetical protein RDWZM_010020 [Blomia tropicalis]|uniref:Uncharacterized protein n=1 Tax=Blomia tropicalis TaxID=40697 RepID=A0A9Q0LXP6_BLOTA|nr:hypothetical protein RDWZM_010020 [Blomia tropicalis]
MNSLIDHQKPLTIMIMVVFIIISMMIDYNHAQDDALISEAVKIFQKVSDKCASKPVQVQQALDTASTCAEPILKDTKSIPVTKR